jgi:glycosyltransferase involved in cell wall biosynthesis
MKILYIGHYRDGTGYSSAALEYIQCMDHVGLDVVPRAFRLNPNNEPLPPKVAELEQKDSAGAEIVIQHTIPTYFQYDGNFRKNIGMFAVEFDTIPQSWVHACNLMDQIWTFTEYGMESCILAGVKVPIRVIPHTFNTDRYKQDVKPASFVERYADDFIFYSIGEFNERKNWSAILRAFHTEFAPHEPVQLLIKTSIPGLPSQEVFKKVTEFCDDVQKKLKLYNNPTKYKAALIVPDRLNEEQLASVHQSCHCFVTASRGEACCIPIIDAMGFHKPVICPDHTAFTEYVPKIGYHKMVRSYKVPCYGCLDTLPELADGRSSWYETDIEALRKTMRHVYESEYKKGQKEHVLEPNFEPFSYETIGNLIKTCLCQETN